MDQSNKKKQRTCIDDLPEEVMSTIMSNLDVRDVVRASLTCKQWLHLPALLSEITLDACSLAGDDAPLISPDENGLFVDRVNKFLTQFQKLQLATGRRTPLLSFRMYFSLLKDSSADMDSWIDFALTNRVKALDIFLDRGICPLCTNSDDDMYVFPCELLNRNTKTPGIVLEKLSLESCVFGRNLSTQLTSLKELHLEAAYLSEDDIANILACCPNLSKLSFSHCALPSTMTVGGQSLAYLKLLWCLGLQQIQLSDGSALTEFIYFGLRISLVEFYSAPKLTYVTFCVNDHDPAKADEYLSQELHRHFPVMKSLLLFKLQETPTRPPVSHIDFHPDAFQRLETLRLYCYSDTRFSLSSVLKMIRACPLIRRLVMVPPVALDCSAKDDDVELPIQAFHNFLNSVQISGFNGSGGHVKLLILLIEASAVLDRVTVTQLEVQTEFIKEEEVGREWRGDEQPEVIRNSLLNLMKRGTLDFTCHGADQESMNRVN